jgi:outer membrane protein TolC
LEIKSSYQEKPDFELLSRNNPFLQGLIARKEASRFSLKSARRNLFPELSATASAGGSLSRSSSDSADWSAGVALSLPLFEGGSRVAEISRANALFKQAEADERSGYDNVILTLEESWIDLQDAIDKIKVQQKFLEAAEERAKIAQAQYTAGLISFDNWTIIEDDLVKAKKSFLDAQANGLIAEAKWIQATGGTLDEE